MQQVGAGAKRRRPLVTIRVLARDILVWKYDLPLTSPSIPESLQVSNQIFRCTTVISSVMLPLALLRSFYLYSCYFYHFPLRFAFQLHDEDFVHFTCEPINPTGEGQVVIYHKNILLSRFLTLPYICTLPSHIRQTIITFALRTSNATGSTTSGISDYAGDRPWGGLGTHPQCCCRAASLPISSLHSSQIAGLVWL
jgi:hypothetical protein